MLANENSDLSKDLQKMLDKLMSPAVEEYYLQAPVLAKKIANENNVNKKIQSLHHISMYYLTSDEFALAEQSLTYLIELSKKHQNKVMQSIAEIYLVVAQAKFQKKQIRHQLAKVVQDYQLFGQRKFDINYQLAHSFSIKVHADYAALEKLALTAIQIAGESRYTEEYFMALWRLANNELNMARRLTAIEELIDLSIEHQLPLNRHILLYNFVSYLIEQQGNPELATHFVQAYIELATQFDNKIELFFAQERKASILSMMGKNEEALQLLLQARELSKDQHQHWVARIDYMQSLQNIVLGEEEKARKLFKDAQNYYVGAGIELPPTMRRISTYLAFMSGNIALGVVEAEKIRLQDIKNAAIERDDSFNVIRELVELEKAANVSAKQSNEYLKLAIIGLVIVLAILLLVTKRQINVSRSLKDSQIKLKRLARTDGLTQLYNRQYWEREFIKEFALLERNSNRVSSLVMFDIDFFKKVNDQYGHAAGDKVLKEISRILKTTIRTTDSCGRYGGEEFVLLLYDTNTEKAEKVAETLRAKIAAKTFSYKEHSIDVSISLGVGQFEKVYLNHKQWLDAVDKALYRAKEQGKNCTALVE